MDGAQAAHLAQLLAGARRGNVGGRRRAPLTQHAVDQASTATVMWLLLMVVVGSGSARLPTSTQGVPLLGHQLVPQCCPPTLALDTATGAAQQEGRARRQHGV